MRDRSYWLGKSVMPGNIAGDDISRAALKWRQVGWLLRRVLVAVGAGPGLRRVGSAVLEHVEVSALSWKQRRGGLLRHDVNAVARGQKLRHRPR